VRYDPPAMNALSRLVGRLAPALLLAGGVTLLTAGLLSFAPPLAGGAEQPDGSPLAGDPALTPDVAPSTPGPRPPPTGVPTYDPFLPGQTSAPSTAEPSQPPATPEPPLEIAYASRIVIPSLRIDLPIVPGDLEVRGNRDFYPLCDVAQYMMEFVQPGQPGTAYLYAHAQRGMFLPMLRASWRDDGAEMIGALVEVYTDDARLHLYEIFRVKRHATDLDIAFNVEPDEHRLVLQTSEGPEGVIPKLQVAARPISVVPTTLEQAVPEASPRACPPR
jgi:hypothetical protein